MTTDGIIDQIGGEKRRAFGKKRFMALIASIQNLPVAEQKEPVRDALIEYQGAERRRDDVSAIGFKI